MGAVPKMRLVVHRNSQNIERDTGSPFMVRCKYDSATKYIFRKTFYSTRNNYLEKKPIFRCLMMLSFYSGRCT